MGKASAVNIMDARLAAKEEQQKQIQAAHRVFSRLDGWARCDPVLLELSPAIREEACEPGVVWRLGAATGWAARQ